MADTIIMFDTEADPGEKFPNTDVRTEIAALAPSLLDPGDVTEAIIADGAVSENKIRAGAVTTTRIATGGVETVNLAARSVTTDRIATGAVTSNEAGTGMVTGYDDGGNPQSIMLVPLTAAQYAAIPVKDPATVYVIHTP